MLWVLGLALSLCGLFVWLELGTMYPRSGGEKVYLEAVYRRPKHFSTLIFAAYAILLKFSSAGCIVSLVDLYIISPNMFCIRCSPKSKSVCAYFYLMHALSRISIVIASGHGPSIWAERGIAVGGVRSAWFFGLNADDTTSHLFHRVSPWIYAPVGCLCDECK